MAPSLVFLRRTSAVPHLGSWRALDWDLWDQGPTPHPATSSMGQIWANHFLSLAYHTKLLWESRGKEERHVCYLELLGRKASVNSTNKSTRKILPPNFQNTLLLGQRLEKSCGGEGRGTTSLRTHEPFCHINSGKYSPKPHPPHPKFGVRFTAIQALWWRLASWWNLINVGSRIFF